MCSGPGRGVRHLGRVNYRIIHASGAATRVNRKEFDGNLEAGNLIGKIREAQGRQIYFRAYVLPGLVAIKRDGAAVLFERQHRVDQDQIRAQLQRIGFDVRQAREESDRIYKALVSKVFRQRSVWASYIQHLIRFGVRSTEGPGAFRNTGVGPRFTAEPLFENEADTALVVW